MKTVFPFGTVPMIMVVLFAGIHASMADSIDPPIPVVVTLPVLKDLVQEIGGSRVTVVSLLSGFEDQHTYTTSPKDVLTIQRARLLVKVGLGLDDWTQDIIGGAGTSDLIVVNASEGIATKDVSHDPQNHTHGNPHIWLDPQNAKKMSHKITEALIQIDPGNESDYQRNEQLFFLELDRLQEELLAKIEPLKNRKIITHHDAWPYFADRFGLEIRGTIVAQTGTEPSVRHMSRLIQLIKKEKIKVIITEPQLNPKLPRILSEETGAKLVTLSPIPGVVKGAESYQAMIKYNLETLLNDLQH